MEQVKVEHNIGTFRNDVLLLAVRTLEQEKGSGTKTKIIRIFKCKTLGKGTALGRTESSGMQTAFVYLSTFQLTQKCVPFIIAHRKTK